MCCTKLLTDNEEPTKERPTNPNCGLSLTSLWNQQLRCCCCPCGELRGGPTDGPPFLSSVSRHILTDSPLRTNDIRQTTKLLPLVVCHHQTFCHLTDTQYLLYKIHETSDKRQVTRRSASKMQFHASPKRLPTSSFSQRSLSLLLHRPSSSSCFLRRCFFRFRIFSTRGILLCHAAGLNKFIL